MRRPVPSTEPRVVRQIMHTYYDRYIHGEDLLPQLCLDDSVTAGHFPSKTQPIAAALIREWSRIREDQFQVKIATGFMARHAIKAQVAGETWSATSILRVGRNAVNFCVVRTENGEQPTAEVGLFERAAFVEEFTGTELPLDDGRVVTFGQNMLQANPDVPIDLLIGRTTNTMAMYYAQPTAAQ